MRLLGLELELTIVSLVEKQSDRLVTIRQWRTNGYMDPAFELGLERARWWRDHLDESEDVVIDDLTDLPPAADFERDYLDERCTASLVAVATGWGSDRFLVAEVLWSPRSWTADELELIGGAARHFGVALSQHAEKRALQHEAARAVADREAKDAFIATLAHELRTPLTAILGYAQLLRSDAAGPLMPKQRQFIGDILACAEHLDQIVNESLTLAKLDSHQMPLDLAEIDLCEVISTAVTSVEPAFAKSGLDLEVELPDEPVVITGDRVKLSQVVINLLTNAVKFTPAGRVEVAISRAEGEVQISVRDTGLGIAAGNLERIFDNFSRVHRSRGKEGTGLGLALVKRLVELHEGRVEVESEPGRGSCFSIILPVHPVGADAGRTAYVERVL